MGGANKLLMRAGESAIVRRAAEEICRAPYARVIAVTGFDRPSIESELTGLPLRFEHNPDFAVGMHGSIRRGLEALPENLGFFSICLADQPLLRASDHELLVNVARVNPMAKLVVPYFGGRRGNPVLISMSLRHEVLARPDDDRGCHYLLAKYGDEAIAVEMPSHAALVDVDTPELFERARVELDGRLAQ